MFFYGEDSVTDNLSPYIDAAPKEEQKYFLATQQVDEARHAVFFHRFFKEVIGAGDTIGSTLAYTLPQLGWGYRDVFDRLDRMADELRRDRSLPKFAQAIALYHMVVEATLAQPGQHFIEDFFTKAGTMPGFSEGMHNVSRDEQRHIGFGVKVLSELLRQSDECKAAVAELLREVLPYSLAVFVPPGWDLELHARATASSSRTSTPSACARCETKWRATGYPIEEMPPDVFPFDPRPAAGGARAAADHAAASRASPASPVADAATPHPRSRQLYFDVDRPLGRTRTRSTAADDDPVALHRRRALARAGRQRLHAGRAGRGAEPRRRPSRPRGGTGSTSRSTAASPGARAAPPAAPARLAANLRRMQRIFPRRPTFASAARRASLDQEAGDLPRRRVDRREVALGVGEPLQRDAVAGGEQVGDDRLGVEAQRRARPRAPSRAAPRRRARGRARRARRARAGSRGCGRPAREQLEEEHVEARVVLDHVLGCRDEHVEHLVDRLRRRQRLVERRDPVSASRRTTSTSSRSLVPK